MNIFKIIFLLASFFTIMACSSLCADVEKTDSYAFTDTAQTSLGKIASQMGGNDTINSTMYLVGEGTDAFLTRMMLLSRSERSVDVQYFIWKSDLIGKLLMHQMIQAAERGVRVRILLDDITLDSKTKAILFAMDQHQNIDVRIYNTLSFKGFRLTAAITNPFRINRRMHNKSFTVDSQYTIIGGRNIKEDYFSANLISNYSDLDIVSVGPMVVEVDKQFDIYWNSPLAEPVRKFSAYLSQKDRYQEVRQELTEFALSKQNSEYALDLKDSDMYLRIVKGISGENSNLLYKGKANVIYDDPEKTLGKSELETTYMTALMQPHMDKIKTSLDLISPYFVPGRAGSDYLIALVKEGVMVRVLTNSLASTDGIMAQSGYARQRIELLKGGVELYELKPKQKSKASRSLRRSAEAKSALHAKTYIFDRKEVYIGSFNFDPRSAKINTELGVICEVPEMAEFMDSEIFEKNISESSYKIELDIEKTNIFGVPAQKEKLAWVETVNGKEVRHTISPETSAWRRFNLNIYSILPIESQL